MDTTGILTKGLPKAKKSLGQHFLKSTKVLEEIIQASNITDQDTILEIGPGQGALTDYLVAAKPKHLILIEKDRDLIPYLREKYGELDFVEIHEGDILTSQQIKLPEEYKVVANIPYYISSPILKYFLLHAVNVPISMTLLVQKEFAEKITALPPRATILSNTVQFLGLPTKIITVPKGAFSPPPKVDSAVLHIQLQKRIEGYRSLVKMMEKCFQQSRKKLSNSIDKNAINMNNTPDKGKLIQDLLQKRPEELTIEDWKLLL
ncbi:MAG: 16S rRNA (adenine(1518)-N(6)/adenine(1519)-N(6))-dimethyltransferase RsmA [Candidatus Gracilibacteria bacterium]